MTTKRGYYATTSKRQDRTSQAIFQGFNGLVDMSTNLNQFTGFCRFVYYLKSNNQEVLVINVSRDGQLILKEESGHA